MCPALPARCQPIDDNVFDIAALLSRENVQPLFILALVRVRHTAGLCCV